MLRRTIAVLAAVTLAWVSATAGTGAVAPPPVATADQLPIVFVHGFMGSGQQFEAQALRLTSNGYDPDLIDVLEYDSLAWPGIQAEVWAELDAKIDRLLADSDADGVVLIGHSQGTAVSQGYLNSDPARAAAVSEYVNLDGGAGGTVPAGIRTLAVWGEGDASRAIPGATNVQFADQAHTEVVNSPETFTEIFTFLFGVAPAVTEVVRETGPVTISGRVLLFPENAGAHDATLDVFPVEPETGRRTGAAISTVELSGDGDFGPLEVDPDTPYEFSITRPDEGTHHVYPQPFVRSSQWVRILSSTPDGIANSFWEPAETSSNMSILRNQEWWGDQDGANDVLAINGQNILDADTAPRSTRVIGIFVHDAGSDGVSGSVADPAPSGLPFLTGVDLVIPASDPATGTTSVRATPRLGAGDETVCVPALSSIDHRISVQFNSWHTLVDADGNVTTPPANPDCGSPQHPVSVPDDDDAVPAPGGSAPPAAPVSRAPAYTG